MKTTIKQYVTRAYLLLITCLYLPAASAQDRGWSEVSYIMTDLANVLGRFLMAACFAIGFGFMLSSIMKYKYHRDNPSAIPISIPLFHLFFGLVMMLLAVFYVVSSPYVFGVDGGTLSALDALLLQST